MNRDELLALAESCCNPAWGDWFSDEDALIQFASLVSAAEREACAQIAFNAKTYIEAAAAIRSRGEK
jgi:hypothetical protein